MGRERKGINKAECIKMYEDGMSVKDIAAVLGCSETAVYWHLRNAPKRSGGGVVAKAIPAHEIHRPVGEAMEKVAEANVANASVLMEGCNINLAGCVGKYTVYTGEKRVYFEVGDYVMNVKYDDLLGLIDELKGVGGCIKHFDVGNMMW